MEGERKRGYLGQPLVLHATAQVTWETKTESSFSDGTGSGLLEQEWVFGTSRAAGEGEGAGVRSCCVLAYLGRGLPGLHLNPPPQRASLSLVWLGQPGLCAGAL